MFLNELISDKLLYGSSFNEEYAVDVQQVVGGNEYRKLLHPYPKLSYTINLRDAEDAIVSSAVDLFHRSGGMFGGFLLKHERDYSTNNYKDVPTFSDQRCVLVSDGVYQITRWYGDESVSTSARRRIKKPADSSVLVGIRDESDNDVEQTNGFTVDYTTGEITFDANVTDIVVGITQAANAVIGFGAAHAYVVDDTVHLSDVVGMTEINGLRGTVLSITANTATIDIDTTGFTAYASGGLTNTRPQTNETVTAGCYFNIPVRFDSDLNSVDFTSYGFMSVTLPVVEILNP